LKEVDLAERVIRWLEGRGWDVYQEVTTGWQGVADIAAVKDGVLWVVETKTSLSFALIDQARERLRIADYVSVAVPDSVKGSRGDTAYWVLRHFGIGLVQVDRYYMESIRETYKPKRQTPDRRRTDKLLGNLCPEHKTYAKAGSPHGRVWTPFKRTCRDALGYVEVNGPCTVRELVEGIEHHYDTTKSAKVNLTRLIDLDQVPGLKLDRRRRPAKVVRTS